MPTEYSRANPLPIFTRNLVKIPILRIYVRVSTENDVETSGKYVEYTWQTFLSNGLRNAGNYTLLFMIGDETIISGTSCDLMEGTVPSVLIKFNILKADLTITSLSETVGENGGFTKEYDGTNEFTSFAIAASVANEGRDPIPDLLVLAPVTVKAVFTDGKNAGNGKPLLFALSGSEAMNYRPISSQPYESVNETSITVSGNILVKQIALDSDWNKTYDGETHFTELLSGSGIIDGDVVYLEGDYDSKDAGMRTVAVSLTSEYDGINYSLAESVFNVVISPKPLTVTWIGDRTSYYDSTEKGLTVRAEGAVNDGTSFETVTLNYIFGGKTGQFTLSAATGASVFEFKEKNAGSYEIELSVADDPNYTLQGADYLSSFEIKAKKITVYFVHDEIADGMYVYDWTITDGKFFTEFSGTERSLDAVITEGDVYPGDVVTAVVEGNRSVNAAEYLAEVTSLFGESSENYELSGNLTQAWAILRADIEGLSLADLEVSYNGKPQGPVLNKNTTQHGIKFAAAYSGGTASAGVNGNNAIIAVGSAEITVTIAETVNYNALSLTSRVTVLPANIDGITFDGKQFVYDGTEHTVSLSSAITSYGDTVEVAYS